MAVKIVEHNAETEGELIQLRESLLSSSIVHPNVVRLFLSLKVSEGTLAAAFSAPCCRTCAVINSASYAALVICLFRKAASTE